MYSALEDKDEAAAGRGFGVELLKRFLDPAVRD